jgi:hypothetical protein
MILVSARVQRHICINKNMAKIVEGMFLTLCKKVMKVMWSEFLVSNQRIYEGFGHCVPSRSHIM